MMPNFLKTVVLTALLGLVYATPASAAITESARFQYEVKAVVYTGLGTTSGSIFNGDECAVGNAVWGGEVETATEAGKVEKLSHGKGALKIRRNGVVGGAVAARTAVQSSLSNSIYSVTTQCEPEQLDDFRQCSDSLLSPLEIFIRVSGERGEPLKIDIDPTVDDAITMVPSLQFECGEPFSFPEADCTPETIQLSTLTKQRVSIPFNCTASTFATPPGFNYTGYFSGGEAHGVIVLRQPKEKDD